MENDYQETIAPEGLVDVHVHLDDEAFDLDRDEVIERARMAGVETLVIAGYAAGYWPRLRALCQRYPQRLFAAYGLHPMYLEEHAERDLDLLETWLVQERPVAVGECGLDYYLPGLDAARQRRFFERQLAIAVNARLPLVIHARKAVDDVIAAIRRHPGSRGLIHSFSGSLHQAQRLVDLGFLISFGGPLTYQRARRLREVARALPLAALLIETDAPDQPLSGYQGVRNEPARLVEVLAALAELRESDPVEIAAATTHNAQQLFGLPV